MTLKNNLYTYEIAMHKPCTNNTEYNMAYFIQKPKNKLSTDEKK